MVAFVIIVGASAVVVASPGGGPPADASNSNGVGPSGEAPGGGGVGELNNTYPDFFDEVNESNLDSLEPLEQRAWAMFKIENTETDRPPETNARYDAVTLLNETVRLHRDDDLRRVESVEAFDKAHRALRRASVLDDEEAVELSTLAVLRANRETAELTVEEAAAVLEDEGAETSSAETHLENARDALDRAEEKTEHGGQPTAVARANSVKEYGKAWEHAQRVLDAVDEQTSPEIRITTNPENYILREGYLEIPLRAVVTDTRPYEIDEATVRVNGEVLDTYELNSGTAPDSGATFSDTIELDTTESIVEVSVEHEGERIADEIAVETPGFADDTYEITVKDDTSGISVDVTGKGVRQRNVRTTDATTEGAQGYEAGPEVRVRAFREFEVATVEVPLDEDVDLDANVSVYRWSPDDDKPWHPIETEIDEEERVARAQVDSISDSYFSAFFVNRWEDRMTESVILDEDDLVADGVELNTLDESDKSDETGEIDTADTPEDRLGAPIVDQKGGRTEIENRRPGENVSNSTFIDEKNTTTGNVSTGNTSAVAGLSGGTVGTVGTESIDVVNRGSQTGRVIQAPDEVEPGDRITIVGEVRNERASARDNIVFGTVGLPDGTVLDVQRMPGLGAGTITHTLTVPNDFGGSLVWSFHQQFTARASANQFRNNAARDFVDAKGRKVGVFILGRNESDDELNDTDGDGIPDVVEEMSFGMPVGPSDVRNQVVDLDPLRADTLGDGVPDNESVKVDWEVDDDGDEVISAEIVDAVANPSLIDTSGNGLPDFQELNVWDSNPLLSDTRGDGYDDFVDPRINENSRPPDVQLLSPVGDYEERINVFVTYTDDIDEIVVDGNYPRLGRSDVRIESRPDSLDVERDGNEYRATAVVDIEKRERPVLPDQPPEWYWVNVTGADGDATNLRVNPQDGGVTFDAERIEAETAAAPAVGTTTGSLGTGALVGIGAGAVAALVQAGSFEEPRITIEKASETIDEPLEIAVPPTATDNTYDPTETPLDEPIRLPSGQVIEEDAAPIEAPPARGHGWELIENELPGVTQDNIDEIIRTPGKFTETEDGYRIVDDNPVGEGGIIIDIGDDGTVLRASQTVEDYDENDIEIDDIVEKTLRKNDWDHNQLGETEDEIKDNLRDILENPSEVYETQDGTERTYVKEMKLNGNDIVVFVFVADGKAITSFVPSTGEGASPPDSTHDEVYERENAINYIIESVLDAGGDEPMEKIEEFEEVIEQIDIGETPEDI